MKYAVIAGGLVENVILWDGVDQAFAAAFDGKQLVELELNSEVSPGWAYASKEFLAPQQPPATTPSVPRIVTMRQARLALLAAGKLDAVVAALDSLESPQKEAGHIEWEYAATVDRDSPLMGLLAAALDLDETKLDELFASAAAY